MNRALRRVSLICLVLFVLLLVNVNYVQGFEASSLANEPGNGRTFSATLQFQRGSIVTSDQKVIAYSKMNKKFGEYQRHYPFGKMYAPVTGYDSLFSQTAIEQAENKQLAGTDPALEVHNLIDLISGKPKKGATVQLTVNAAAQQAAYNALRASGRESGVVAINPQTGAILALASNPTFDPNLYTTLDGKTLDKNDSRLLARSESAPAEPGDQRHVPARLDLQDRDQLHRVRDREGRRPEHAGPRADQAHPAGHHHPADQ